MNVHEIDSGDDVVTRGRATIVTLGDVDDDARKVFTNGWCWALTAQLAAARGWEPVALFASDGEWWLHTGALRPDGVVVDIEGGHRPDAWARDWSVRLAGWLDFCDLDPDLVVRPFGNELMASAPERCGSNAEEALQVAASFVDAVAANAERRRRGRLLALLARSG